MRSPRRLPWIDVANGALVALLTWHWAYHDTRHAILDAATMSTLLVGFLAGVTYAWLGRRAKHRADTERRDALLLFPEEGQDAIETPRSRIEASTDRTASFTILTHAVLMIALSWRWAYRGEPYTMLGAVTLSTLMLGFFRAAATIVERLGRPSQAPALRENEEQSALLLFPAEDSRATDLVLAPQLLATRRKALL